MHVLVAGGAGFIGSHVCEELLARGHEVTCLDNLLTGSRQNIAHLDGRTGFRFVAADAAHSPELRPELVLHLASPASPVHYRAHAIETLLVNSVGTHALLELARTAGARFMLASTSEVYGDPLVHPQREDYWGNVNPIGPRACYDEGKRFSEAMTFEYRRTHGLNATIIRIFNTYGPRMDPDDGRAVPAFVKAALAGEPIPLHGDGSQTRSFCYVGDLVDGMLRVALDRLSDGGVFNIGNPHEITVRELAGTIVDITGSAGGIEQVDRPEGDPERRRPDITKMRERYGWEPATPLREGLQRTIESFRAAPRMAAVRVEA